MPPKTENLASSPEFINFSDIDISKVDPEVVARIDLLSQATREEVTTALSKEVAVSQYAIELLKQFKFRSSIPRREIADSAKTSMYTPGTFTLFNLKVEKEKSPKKKNPDSMWTLRTKSVGITDKMADSTKELHKKAAEITPTLPKPEMRRLVEGLSGSFLGVEILRINKTFGPDIENFILETNEALKPYEIKISIRNGIAILASTNEGIQIILSTSTKIKRATVKEIEDEEQKAEEMEQSNNLIRILTAEQNKFKDKNLHNLAYTIALNVLEDEPLTLSQMAYLLDTDPKNLLPCLVALATFLPKIRMELVATNTEKGQIFSIRILSKKEKAKPLSEIIYDSKSTPKIPNSEPANTAQTAKQPKLENPYKNGCIPDIRNKKFETARALNNAINQAVENLLDTNGNLSTAKTNILQNNLITAKAPRGSASALYHFCSMLTDAVLDTKTGVISHEYLELIKKGIEHKEEKIQKDKPAQKRTGTSRRSKVGLKSIPKITNSNESNPNLLPSLQNQCFRSLENLNAAIKKASDELVREDKLDTYSARKLYESLSTIMIPQEIMRQVLNFCLLIKKAIQKGRKDKNRVIPRKDYLDILQGVN